MISRRRQDALTRLYYPKLVPKSQFAVSPNRSLRRFHRTNHSFGSYAYGTPTPDSDVDLLVVMPTRNQVEQAVRIDEPSNNAASRSISSFEAQTLANRLRWGDSYLRETWRGAKCLEKNHKAWYGSRARRPRRQAFVQAKLLSAMRYASTASKPSRSILKSMLAERGLPIIKP